MLINVFDKHVEATKRLIDIAEGLLGNTIMHITKDVKELFILPTLEEAKKGLVELEKRWEQHNADAQIETGAKAEAPADKA